MSLFDEKCQLKTVPLKDQQAWCLIWEAFFLRLKKSEGSNHVQVWSDIGNMAVKKEEPAKTPPGADVYIDKKFF